MVETEERGACFAATSVWQLERWIFGQVEWALWLIGWRPRDFFDQNPLNHLGVILLRNGIAHRLTDLSGSPGTHIRALRSNMECAGDASIQNALDLARGCLTQIPSYGHREIMLVFSALSTIDPGDIMDAVQKCKEANIRCSVVGLSAEIFICKLLCDETGGIHSMATNEAHLKELIMEHAPPPSTQANTPVASPVRMGFPQSGAEDAVALCACHREVKTGGGCTCPCCKARICELPIQCHICGLTLVSSPHLARSYHHLFPVLLEKLPTWQSQMDAKACLGVAIGVCRSFRAPEGRSKGFDWHAHVVGSIFALIVTITFMRVCIIALAEILPCRRFRRVTICFNGSELIKDKWSSAYDVRIILVSIQSLLGEPNNDSPPDSYAAAFWSDQEEFKKVMRKQYRDAAALRR